MQALPMGKGEVPMEFRSDNFHDLYLDVLEAHAHAFEFINAPRGQEQKERLFVV